MAKIKKKEVKEKTADSGIRYEGRLTIEKVRGDKVVKKTTIKNTGCEPLFRFLANCLVSTLESAKSTGLFNSQPQYLDCFYQDPAEASEEIAFGDLASHRVKSYMKQIDASVKELTTSSTLSGQTKAGYSVNIKFLLQDNNFAKQDSQFPINIVALYDSKSVGNYTNPSMPHAYIYINDPDDFLRYVDGVNYILTWSLVISNDYSAVISN